jgi:hypothetical protein
VARRFISRRIDLVTRRTWPEIQTLNLFGYPAACSSLLSEAENQTSENHETAGFVNPKSQQNRPHHLAFLQERQLPRCRSDLSISSLWFFTDDYLKGPASDRFNAVMSAVGFNLCLVLKWLKIILRESLPDS